MSHIHKLSVAPMMDWTDRHCRYFMRLLSPSVLLYTEMVTSGAIIHGDRQRFLGFDPAESPVALQLGGNNPDELALCAKIAEDWGYDEVNLNVGCPSDRVQNGRFGACLMKEADLVAECITSMQQQVTIPVTVKTRIGVDEFDDYAFLHRFVETIANRGCTTFIIHARKAWLKGLSPKQNREIPPLQYDKVTKLKQDFPSLQLILNGGIKTIDEVTTLASQFDGLMIGRAAYQDPMLLVACEQVLFDPNYTVDREAVLATYMGYAEKHLAAGVPLNILTKPLLGLFNGRKGARAWRRCLAEETRLAKNVDVIAKAAAFVA